MEADLLTAGITVKPQNPFEELARLPVGAVLQSPYTGGIEAMWSRVRAAVLAHFPAPPRSMPDEVRYLQRMNEIYTHDADHSLSIEGYLVPVELVQRIADGVWNPTEMQR